MGTWLTQFQGSDAPEGKRIDAEVTETTDNKVIIALKSGKKEGRKESYASQRHLQSHFLQSGYF